MLDPVTPEERTLALPDGPKGQRREVTRLSQTVANSASDAPFDKLHREISSHHGNPPIWTVSHLLQRQAPTGIALEYCPSPSGVELNLTRVSALT